MANFSYFQKLFKTHLYYLCTKKNIILIIIFNILIFLFSIYSSSIFDGYYQIDSLRKSYFESFNESYFFFIKIFYICFIIFINISFFSGEHSKYSEFFIRNRKTKIIFYTSKYLSLIFFIFLELIYLLFIYELIIIILPLGSNYFLYLDSFINLYFIGIFYCFLSSLILNIFKSYLSSFIALIIYWFGVIATDNMSNSLFNIIVKYAIPSLDNKSLIFLPGYPILFIYITILVILNALVLLLRDGV